ncbi:Protein of unknown function [Gryllus bimaculatus]|nr:Protein of unknown function [Gryllus bimaculatus]
MRGRINDGEMTAEVCMKMSLAMPSVRGRVLVRGSSDDRRRRRRRHFLMQRWRSWLAAFLVLTPSVSADNLGIF